VLQEKVFERVGGAVGIHANVRVICATHCDLKAMVERGEFREDLYYRLRGIILEIPPLRARMGDLPRIAEHLLDRIAFERGEEPKRLSPEAFELLERHRWQGNVRELENALRAATLFADGEVVAVTDLSDNVEDLKALRPKTVPPSDAVLIDDGGSVPTLLGDEDGDLPAGEAGPTAVAYACVRQGAVSLADLKRQIERDCIARALAETRGNITRAAALLGMKRPRLSQLVKQYGLAAVSTED
jgi:DNA-binding NtrC family response regulator